MAPVTAVLVVTFAVVRPAAAAALVGASPRYTYVAVPNVISPHIAAVNSLSDIGLLVEDNARNIAIATAIPIGTVKLRYSIILISIGYGEQSLS